MYDTLDILLMNHNNIKHIPMKIKYDTENDIFHKQLKSMQNIISPREIELKMKNLHNHTKNINSTE